MIGGGLSLVRRLVTGVRMQASFYKTINFFSDLEGISSSNDKQKAIASFRTNLSEPDRKEFDALMYHINSKARIGLTTKVVNSFYIKKIAPNTEPSLLEEGGLANQIGNGDEESELTLYDVNFFLRMIGGTSGPGSQADKSLRVIDTVKAISKKEGLYLLRIIDHKLTIGAKEKTFKNASKTKTKIEEPDTKKEAI